MSATKPKDYVLKPYKPSAKSKPSNLIPTSKEFLDLPAPEIIFQGRSFCFTGVFSFANGDRNQCETATKARGGFCYERPNRALNYLVVGNYAEPSWGHGSFGRKIIAVLDFKSSGAKCQIISEDNWVKTLQDTPESLKAKTELVQDHSKSNQLIQLQKNLDNLTKQQQLIVDALKAELTPEDYRKITERLRKLGVAV
jgi:BRCA1 C Terminus (BRCT) domain